MRTAIERESAALDELAREMRRRRQEKPTVPAPNVPIQEVADMWWQELAGKVGSR